MLDLTVSNQLINLRERASCWLESKLDCKSTESMQTSICFSWSSKWHSCFYSVTVLAVQALWHSDWLCSLAESSWFCACSYACYIVRFSASLLFKYLNEEEVCNDLISLSCLKSVCELTEINWCLCENWHLSNDFIHFS